MTTICQLKLWVRRTHNIMAPSADQSYIVSPRETNMMFRTQTLTWAHTARCRWFSSYTSKYLWSSQLASSVPAFLESLYLGLGHQMKTPTNPSATRMICTNHVACTNGTAHQTAIRPYYDRQSWQISVQKKSRSSSSITPSASLAENHFFLLW